MPRRPSVRGGPGPSKIVARGSLPVRSEIALDPNWWARPRTNNQRHRKIGLGHNRHGGGSDDTGMSSGTLFEVITQAVDGTATFDGSSALTALGERAAQPIREGSGLFDGQSAITATGALYVPAVGWVKSVEKLSTTFAASTTGTASLTKGQLAQNCFPLPFSQKGPSLRFGSAHCVSIAYSGSTATFTRTATDNDTCVSYCVEVFQNAARVQRIDFTLGSGATSATLDIPITIDTTKTFAVLSYNNSYTGGQVNQILLRCRIVGNSTAGISLTRQAGGSSVVSGSVYLVESLTDAFTVQQVDIDTTTNATATGTITAVTTDKTFLVGSLEHRGTTATPDLFNSYYTLTNTTTVTAGKGAGGASDQAIATVFAVSLKSDGGTVQRGTITRAVSTAGSTGTATISAVTLANSALISNSHMGAGITASTTLGDIGAFTQTLEITDATTVTVYQELASTTASRTHYFEVVDFTLAT